MLHVLKVTGASLEPVYQEGDFVFVSKIPFLFRPLRPGDAVVFRHSAYGLMIKLVERVMPGGEVWVAGLRPSSVDSYEFGPVSRRALLGKVIVHVQNKHRKGKRKDPMDG